MEKDNKKPAGHAIVTYKMRLYDRHFTWLQTTKELYGRVVQHFFSVLMKEEVLLAQSDFLLLRALEEKCIGTKEMKAAGRQPDYPLTDFPKIPLYFRRSAINMAIGLARKGAGTIEPNIVLYKGMYQNFTDETIELKLFNGEKWVWVMYPFAGRAFPKEAERLSPTLVVGKKHAHLLVPVSTGVDDTRTVKERMQTEDRICAVYFPDNDVMACAVILSKDGTELAHRTFRGGKQKEHQRKQLIQQLNESRESRGRTRENVQQENGAKREENENAALYAGLKNLNQYYSHSISRQILDYCLRQDIKVIVVPNYEAKLDFADKKYLKTDEYRWLGRSMIKNLKYKAFKSGMVVTSVRPYHIADRCFLCGETIRKYNEGHAAGQKYHGGKLFLCPNGHTGNTARNAAGNVGKLFLSYFK